MFIRIADMIISHKYKFIFVKTTKTAGTSLEISLSKYLDEQDIITPLNDEEEEIRKINNYKGSNNYLKDLNEWSLDDYYDLPKRVIKSFRDKNLKKIFPLKFAQHSSAYQIKQQIDSDIWENYFKFAVERNPWEKVVSGYYWTLHHNNEKNPPSFRDYVLKRGCGGGIKGITNYDLYSIYGEPAMDFIIRYEQLYEGLEYVRNQVGLPVELIDLMKNTRSKSFFKKDKAWQDHYDEETIHKVSIQFAREIKFFGYTFPDKTL